MRKTIGCMSARMIVLVLASCVFLLAAYFPPDAKAGQDLPGLPTQGGRDHCGGQSIVGLWLGQDGQCSWVCPSCGERANISWISTCLSCGYGRDNRQGYLFKPVEKGSITNRYSPSHRAIDIGVPEGSPVFAARDGIVIESSRDAWAGNVLTLLHEDGLQTRYGHLRERLVARGGYVRMGEVIALSGSTGTASGPHLHFEVSVDGKETNPLDYLAAW